jgi:hypothetical protein
MVFGGKSCPISAPKPRLLLIRQVLLHGLKVTREGDKKAQIVR